MDYKSQVMMGEMIPILRIFDRQKTMEFYVDYLDFTVDWEHRFEEGLPLYLQVSRGNCVIHLSEHHGDCSPGAAIRIGVENIEGLHSTLCSKVYDFARPCLEETPWGMTELTVIDPFSNRIIFFENKL
ncbi:glyoxalase superfamily protein [Sporosarcina sp. NPDC096371]|uniref:glyoxalase superfamily protein n=1 Tax=Sporosarcina sp. NPDC096371 TaxID=3364530 RepID=UPI0038106DC9